jgi:hypothetical protein
MDQQLAGWQGQQATSDAMHAATIDQIRRGHALRRPGLRRGSGRGRGLVPPRGRLAGPRGRPVGRRLAPRRARRVGAPAPAAVRAPARRRPRSDPSAPRCRRDRVRRRRRARLPTSPRPGSRSGRRSATGSSAIGSPPVQGGCCAVRAARRVRTIASVASSAGK